MDSTQECAGRSPCLACMARGLIPFFTLFGLLFFFPVRLFLDIPRAVASGQIAPVLGQNEDCHGRQADHAGHQPPGGAVEHALPAGHQVADGAQQQHSPAGGDGKIAQQVEEETPPVNRVISCSCEIYA